MHNERPNTLDIPSHDEASAVMRHVRENVARRQLEDLPLVLVLLAVLYAFHGCVALNVVAFGPVYIPFFIAAVALICCAFFLSRIRSWRWSHPAIATIVGLLLATTLVSIHSAGNPLETTTLLIIVVAAGFVFASTGWLFFVLALIGICWSILAWTTFSPDHFRHFSMSLLTAILVSLLMHVQRLGSLREAQRLHVLSERRNMQLQEEVQRRMLAESTLLESQRELENRVADRTTELANSNESFGERFASGGRPMSVRRTYKPN